MDFSSFGAAALRHADKWLFFAVFLVGSLLIIVFDAAHVSKFLAVLICATLLFGYAAATSLIPAVRLRPDQAADNSYYLGLLYTLTSLGVALFRFSTAENAADAILRNFGIAIATTIVGLGLRVFLSQFREDPDDLEFEAKTALAESVRGLRGELDRSLAEMQNFAVGAKQALEEVSEATNKNTLETLAATVGRFESAADEMSRKFEATGVGFESQAGAFDRSLDRLSTVVESLSDRIGAVRADSDLFQQGLQPVFDGLNESVARFSRTFEAEQQHLSSGLAALSRLGGSLAMLDQSSGAIASSSQRLFETAAAINEGATSFERLDQASRSAADAAMSFGQQLQSIAQEQANHGRETLDELARAAELITQRTAASLTTVDESAQEVARSLGKLNTEFSGSDEAVIRVRRELAELAGWIITRLDAK
jgi:ABC-type transporter Mla subunit MlaD